jgi:hypothetical protein
LSFIQIVGEADHCAPGNPLSGGLVGPPGDLEVSFDDFVVNVIPEPAAMTLFLVAVLIVVSSRHPR